MRSILATLLLCLVGVVVGLYHLGHSDNRRISRQIKHSLASMPEVRPPASAPDDYMEVAGRGMRFYHKTACELLRREGNPQRLGVCFYHMGNPRPIAATALGTDAGHHFVNAFLVGFAPFETEEPWVPIYALSLRLNYRLDQNLFGSPEVWQTSEQAYFNALGDCEDHSILLADWLIEMGYDARVVLGVQRGGGHAWVVVFGKSEVYLLEATAKRKIKNWKQVPLARMATDYHGQAMFNRDTFWIYAGQAPSPDYRSPAWQMVSHFVAQRG